MSQFEGRPTAEQRARLYAWLADVYRACRQHRIILNTDPYPEAEIIDLDSDTIIGFGFEWLFEDYPQGLASLDAAGSILDGVWLVNTADGVVEQRHAGKEQS